MSEFHKSEDKSESLVRRLLKLLPEVKASDDFENRLQRRIANEPSKSHAKSLIGKFIIPRSVPAFTYSLATIIVFGIVSYYVLFRSGNIPKQESPMHQEFNAVPQQNAEELEKHGVPINVGSNAKETNSNKERKQLQAPSIKGGDIPSFDQGVLKRKYEETDNGAQHLEQPAAQPLEDERSARDKKTQKEESSASSAQGELSRREPQIAPVVGGKTQNESSEKIMAEPTQQAAPSMIAPDTKTAVFNDSTIVVPKAARPQFHSYEYYMLQKKDSVKADSIRRAQQQFQLQQQKAKGKKPV